MTTNQKAAALIRSLMRDLSVSNHIVYPRKKSADDKPMAIFASVVLREREQEDTSANKARLDMPDCKDHRRNRHGRLTSATLSINSILFYGSAATIGLLIGLLI